MKVFFLDAKIALWIVPEHRNVPSAGHRCFTLRPVSVVFVLSDIGMMEDLVPNVLICARNVLQDPRVIDV